MNVVPMKFGWLASGSFRFGIIALAFSLIGFSSLFAQEKPAKGLAGEPLSSEAIARIEDWIESARKEWSVPGLSVAVVHQDRVVLCQGFGTLQVDSDTKVDRETLFAIASNTKAFTAAALAMLVEEKKISWDDPVRKHLPWLELYDPWVAADLRIRDLLCHRSGLGTFSGDLLWYGTPYTPREILERSKHLKPEGPYRAHYGYSNLMFLAAGEVIEAVSGQSWSKFIRTKILEPAKMNRTVASTHDLGEKGNFASPHKTFLDRSVPIEWVPWDSMAAAGGLISSAEDMSQWLRIQLARGSDPVSGTRFFSLESSLEMWEAHTPIRVSANASKRIPSTHFKAYGLGWALADYQGRKLVSHGGGYDGMYSHVLLVPEEKLGIVVLTNSMTSLPDTISYTLVDRFLRLPDRDWSSENLTQFRKSREAFRTRIDRQIQPVASNTQPSQGLEAYTGSFRCPMYGEVKVEQDQGKLTLRMVPNPNLVADLEHLHYDTWILRWRNESAWFEEGTVQFVPDAKGKMVELKMDVPNDDLWFHELLLSRDKSP